MARSMAGVRFILWFGNARSWPMTAMLADARACPLLTFAGARVHASVAQVGDAQPTEKHLVAYNARTFSDRLEGGEVRLQKNGFQRRGIMILLAGAATLSGC